MTLDDLGRVVLGVVAQKLPMGGRGRTGFRASMALPTQSRGLFGTLQTAPPPVPAPGQRGLPLLTSP